MRLKELFDQLSIDEVRSPKFEAIRVGPILFFTQLKHPGGAKLVSKSNKSDAKSHPFGRQSYELSFLKLFVDARVVKFDPLTLLFTF